MPISFNQIPAGPLLKVPLYWVEIDPSQAGLPNINYRALLFGTMIATGDGVPDVPIPIGSQAQANQHFGMGSELARMFQAFYANNFANEVWGLPLAEPVGASAATGTITITAPPTAAGTIHLYIAGTYVPVNILTTDAISDIATAINDAINTDDTLPVTSTVAAGVVTMTSIWKGVGGNEINVMINYYGARGGQQTPVGLGITLPQGTGTTGTGTGTSTGTTNLTISGTVTGTIVSGAAVTGTGVPTGTTIRSQTSGTPGGAGVYVTNQLTTLAGVALTFTGVAPPAGFLHGGVGTPPLTNAITNMGEEPFEYLAVPWTDSNTLFEIDQQMGFTDEGRWGWQRELFGHAFFAKRGAYSDLLLFGETNNSGVESIMAFEVASPSPAFEWAAAYAAKAQRALINDPARPLQSLSLNQIKLAPLHQRFDFVEINSLASTGLAIQKAGSDNQPMIAREQTTYQLNLYGQSLH